MNENIKHLYIETYGCQMNVADSEVIASVMKMAGYDPCEELEQADAVLLNTCSIRDNAEQKILHRLDALNALRKKGRNHGSAPLGSELRFLFFGEAFQTRNKPIHQAKAEKRSKVIHPAQPRVHRPHIRPHTKQSLQDREKNQTNKKKRPLLREK